MTDPDRVEVFAQVVADGETLDASTLPDDLNDEQLAALQALRIVEQIARLHRSSHDPLNGVAPASGSSESAPGPPAPALFTWGDQHILEHLGSGTYGDVFRAWEPSLDREVALKLLRGPRGSSDVMVREGQLLARIRHPNVMAVYGAMRVDDRVGIWGELLRGRTLDEILRLNGPMSAQEAGLVVDAVCRALSAVHRAGLLHRDIKAQNVMREAGGRIVLMDLGLGREAHESTPGREYAGTPLYLAPEIFHGGSTSVQSDIYSVGVLLFYLVTGRFPVEADSLEALAERHAAQERARVQDLRSDLPAAFAQVLDRALAANPHDRFPSAGALQAALAAATQLAPPEPRAIRTGFRNAIIAVAAAVAAVSVVAAAVWYRSQHVDTLELTLSAPPGLTFTEGSRNVPAVSPDGEQVAFLATDAAGRMQLWVRSLADPVPRLIPGSENATRPFWSPDGHTLAFFSSRGLWTVDVSGARPELLAGGTESRGGAWGSQNTLLVALDPKRGLEAMDPRAGSPRHFVTQVDPSRNETQHMWPQFLPDGRHFIFFIMSGDESTEGVYLGTLDGGRASQLVKTHTSAVYARGRLLYTTNGGLFAQALDVARATLTGEPSALHVPVEATYDALLMLSVSDNATAVYVRPELRQLAWYDFSGQELEKIGSPDRFRNPVLSPDGRSLIVERYRLGLSELVTTDATRAGALETLPLPARPTCPIWAPDGRLAFSAAPGLSRDIFVTDLRSPQNWSLLVRSPEDKEPSGWAPDGQTMIYVSFASSPSGRNQDLWTWSRNSGPVPLLQSPAAEVNGVFSPGGRWMAYVSNAEGEPHVYVRDERGILQKIAGLGFDPSWRSDQELLYLDQEAFLWSVSVAENAPPQTTRLFRAPLKTPRTSRNNYALSPDHRRILFNATVPDSGPTTFSVIVNWTALR